MERQKAANQYKVMPKDEEEDSLNDLVDQAVEEGSFQKPALIRGDSDLLRRSSRILSKGLKVFKNSSSRFGADGSIVLLNKREIDPDAWFQCILPDDKKKLIWDWIVIILSIYNGIFIPFHIGFHPEIPTSLIVFHSLIDIMFVFDIVLRLNTGFYNQFNEIVIIKREIQKRYIFSSRFAVDIISVLPLELISLAWNSSIRSTIYPYFTIHKLLRLRLVWISERFTGMENAKSRIIRLLGAFLLFGHVCGCAFFWIGRIVANANPTRPNWILQENLDVANIESQYITSFFWACTTMITVGYGDITPQNDAERVMTTIIMLVSAVIYASIFGNISVMIQGMDSSYNRFRLKMETVTEFVRLYQLPHRLEEKLTGYSLENWHQYKGFDMEQLMSELPQGVRMEIMMYLHQNLVRQVPLFKNCDTRFVGAIVTRLSIHVLLPGDFLFHQGDKSRDMYFIRSGAMEVMVPDEGGLEREISVATLGPGAFFGEISLLTGQPRTASMKAATKCELCCLKKEDLDEVLSQYPEYRSQLRNTAFHRVKRDLERTDDDAPNTNQDLLKTALKNLEGPDEEEEEQMKIKAMSNHVRRASMISLLNETEKNKLLTGGVQTKPAPEQNRNLTADKLAKHDNHQAEKEAQEKSHGIQSTLQGSAESLVIAAGTGDSTSKIKPHDSSFHNLIELRMSSLEKQMMSVTQTQQNIEQYLRFLVQSEKRKDEPETQVNMSATFPLPQSPPSQSSGRALLETKYH